MDSPPIFLAIAAVLAAFLAPGSLTLVNSQNDAARVGVRSDRAAQHATKRIRIEDRAGAVVIGVLPKSIDGRPVSAYRAIRTPALSFLHGRSFFWRSTLTEQGVHQLVFEARLEASRADTVVVDVVLRRPD